jgi:hypothetical protein
LGGGATHCPYFYKDMTLEQIASAIRSHVKDGLKEVYNHDYSIPLLEDEILNVRNDLLFQLSMQPVGFNPGAFAQRVENLKLDLRTIPSTGLSYGPKKFLHFELPVLSLTLGNKALTYVGPNDMETNFKKYFDQSFAQHQYNVTIAQRPFVYIDLSQTADNKQHGYIGNTDTTNMRFITVIGVFENPYSVLDNGLFHGDLEFPAPMHIQSKIIDTLTAKYIDYYRKLHMQNQPNTQTETNI